MSKRCLDLDSDGTTKLVFIDFFIDRSVVTRITLFLPLSYTVTDFKKKILLEHEHFYPKIGALTINQLVIERPGMTCYLHSSDMLVRKAFEGYEEDWHLFVDASSSEVVKDFANPLHPPPCNTGKTEFADPLHPCNKDKTECPRTTVCKSCGEVLKKKKKKSCGGSSQYGLEVGHVDDAWSKDPDGPVVCVATSLNTNLIVTPSFSDTVADFQKKIVHKHEELFPKTGALSINSLQVEYEGDMYPLKPEMSLRSALKGLEHWSLFADVVAPAVAAKHLKEGKREAKEVIEMEVSKKKQKKKDVATKEARVKTEKKKVVKKQESSDDSSSSESEEEQKVVKGKVADDDAPPKKVLAAVPKKNSSGKHSSSKAKQNKIANEMETSTSSRKRWKSLNPTRDANVKALKKSVDPAIINDSDSTAAVPCQLEVNNGSLTSSNLNSVSRDSNKILLNKSNQKKQTGINLKKTAAGEISGMKSL